MDADEGWLRLSTLQHFAYCPAQASLILEGVWTDNRLTVEGTAVHEHVDTGTSDRRRGHRIHHAVPVGSELLKIYGVADAVEESVSGVLVPVEHKRGRGAGDLWPTTVQVVAQSLCLEEMTGLKVERAAIFIVTERRREYLEVDRYRDRVIELIDDARETLLSRSVRGVYEAWRCQSCSVRNACQPSG